MALYLRGVELVNVQCTHPDPRIAAMEMDDKRVSKMVLESAQMYCTITGDPAYRPVHQNNPTTEWCSKNLSWLVEWHHALAAEHFYRTGHAHKSFIDVGQRMQSSPRKRTPTFRNGARSSKVTHDGREIDFTHIEDVHKAYRWYLRCRMLFDTVQPKWTRRPPPWWLDEKNETNFPMIHAWDVWPRTTTPITFKVTPNQITRERYGLLSRGPKWWDLDTQKISGTTDHSERDEEVPKKRQRNKTRRRRQVT